MTVNTRTSAVLSGPKLVQVFLGELSDFIRRHPDREVDGAPRQIVEQVVSCSTRFADCTEKTIENLSHQLTMAVKYKGERYRLAYHRLTDGRVKVKYA